MNYQAYLASEEWQVKRHEALERAERECTLCTETRCLEVHHKTYERIGQELPKDLVVLCYLCHRRHHGTLQKTRARCMERHEGQMLLMFDAIVPEGVDLN